jgi:hypothetical protein
MTLPPYQIFVKIYQAVQKVLAGDTQTDRQTGDLISLLSFLERRLTNIQLNTIVLKGLVTNYKQNVVW